MWILLLCQLGTMWSYEQNIIKCQAALWQTARQAAYDASIQGANASTLIGSIVGAVATAILARVCIVGAVFAHCSMCVRCWNVRQLSVTTLVVLMACLDCHGDLRGLTWVLDWSLAVHSFN